MRIGIVSDSHDHRKLLVGAVRDAAEMGAMAIVHCGDIVAPSTLRTLASVGLPVHAVEGNNTGDVVVLCGLAAETDGLVQFYGRDAALTLAGRRLFVVHYPHYARAMACTGDWDVVCFGHEHRVIVERVPTVRGTETLLLNPGTVAGIGDLPSYVLLDLDTLNCVVRQFAAPRSWQERP